MNLRKSGEKTYVEFAYYKAECFERWVTSKNVDRGYEKLKELILVEEFKRSIPEEIGAFLNEKDVATLQDSVATLHYRILILPLKSALSIFHNPYLHS